MEIRKPEDFINVGKELCISSLKVYEIGLVDLEYTLDKEYKFNTKIMYPREELTKLKTKLSENEWRRLFCHIALMEGLKFCITFPHTYDITLIADGLGEESLEFFREVAGRAWSQHCYENGVVNYWGPSFTHSIPLGGNTAISVPLTRTILASNGGGKDSFLVLKCLERAGESMSVFQHARTEYGKLKHQHYLQDKVYKHVSKDAINMVHRIDIIDDFTEGEVVSLLNPNLRGECAMGNPCQVGWPEMVFEALPFVINYGYYAFTLGNERSADTAQAISTEFSDKDVSHQWLKSSQAQLLLSNFLSKYLIKSFDVFSLLKSVYDYRIYKAISHYPGILHDIHSCNVTKPWCKRCSKCAYVWVNLCAVFGHELVYPHFQENLFDVEELEGFWIELLGLSSHNAWECVGETNETRLAFKKCLERGMEGKAMNVFKEKVLTESINWNELLERLDVVHYENTNIPKALFDKVAPYL